MNITSVTSRELNQDVARAKTAAKSGPVFITDRGKPAHVLLSIEATGLALIDPLDRVIDGMEQLTIHA